MDKWHFEDEGWKAGYRCIAGIDEVGRGPLAGPVVACALVFVSASEAQSEFEVDDSKKLTAGKREGLATRLLSCGNVRVGLGVVEVETIDTLNILKATHLAMRQALSALDPPADFALVDGRPVAGLPVPSRAIVGGDALSASVAAASIVAKVHRDRLMREYDERFPGYGFARHKGYGTRAHLAALRRLGPSPIHRKTFSPVARILNGGWYQPELGLHAQSTRN